MNKKHAVMAYREQQQITEQSKWYHRRDSLVGDVIIPALVALAGWAMVLILAAWVNG